MFGGFSWTVWWWHAAARGGLDVMAGYWRKGRISLGVAALALPAGVAAVVVVFDVVWHDR